MALLAKQANSLLMMIVVGLGKQTSGPKATLATVTLLRVNPQRGLLSNTLRTRTLRLLSNTPRIQTLGVLNNALRIRKLQLQITALNTRR